MHYSLRPRQAPRSSFPHFPNLAVLPMALQMSGLRHQNRNIKASIDRLRELVRPLVKAYVLGYASSTTPRLVTLLVTLVTRQSKDGEDRKFQRALFSAYRILRGGLELQRFPTFCASLIGGTSLLQVRRSFSFSYSTPRMLSQFGGWQFSRQMWLCRQPHRAFE